MMVQSTVCTAGWTLKWSLGQTGQMVDQLNSLTNVLQLTALGSSQIEIKAKPLSCYANPIQPVSILKDNALKEGLRWLLSDVSGCGSVAEGCLKPIFDGTQMFHNNACISSDLCSSESFHMVKYPKHSLALSQKYEIVTSFENVTSLDDCITQCITLINYKCK